jgi:hypothetical protein
MLYELLMVGHLDNETPFDWLQQTIHVEKMGIHVLYPITSEDK